MDIIFNILLFSFLGFYLSAIIFLIFGLSKLKFTNSNKLYKVSVIIPFRNEEYYIEESITSLLSQDYPKELTEIIYVNDESVDNSVSIVNKYTSIKNLFLINSYTDKILSRKKIAIEKGILNSSGEIILTTDADCRHERSWISNMIKQFDDKTGFVTGTVVYDNCNTLFEKIQKLEFQSLVGIGASLISLNYPILANGATAGYRKNVFNEVGGFNDNYDIISGDDELLMHKIFTYGYSINFCFAENSKVFTRPNRGLIEFINQRKRWISVIPFYKKKQITILLTLIYFFYLSIPLLLIFSTLNINYLKYFVIVFMLKLIIDLIFMKKVTKIFREKFSFLIFLFSEILHIPYILLIPLVGITTNFDWKGRKSKGKI